MTENHTLINRTTWDKMVSCDTKRPDNGAQGCTSTFKKGWNFETDPVIHATVTQRGGKFAGTRASLRIVKMEDKYLNGATFVIAIIQNELTDVCLTGGTTCDIKTLSDDIIMSVSNWPEYDMFKWNGALVPTALSTL